MPATLITKVCGDCGVEKTAHEFFGKADKRADNKRSKRYLDSCCKGCRQERNRAGRVARGKDAVNAQAREIAARNREVKNASNRRRKFGVSPEQFDEMLRRQDGVCAICAGPETRKYRGVLRSLSVDHDHETGRVRGLLCASCNTLLGMARDEVARLRTAIDYLERT